MMNTTDDHSTWHKHVALSPFMRLSLSMIAAAYHSQLTDTERACATLCPVRYT